MNTAQTTKNLPKSAKIVKSDQIEPFGYDGGFGSVKLVSGSHQILMPSYFMPVTSELYGLPDTDKGCLIEYLDGTAQKLIGERWFAGEMANIYAPDFYYRVTDHEMGKIVFGLRILLGAIALTKPLQQQTLSIMASIQDAQALGGDLKNAIEGIHCIRVNDSWEACLNIRVEKVIEEGIGTSFHCRQQGLLESGSNAALLDLGNGTTIVSVISGGTVIHRKVLPNGVNALIAGICEHIDVRKRLGAEGKPHLVRAGLERGDFIYGRGRKAWNFGPIYQELAVSWCRFVLAPALKAASRWKSEYDIILATGGGTQLPGIENILSKQGIEVLPDGVFTNARGLYGLAQLKQRRVA